MILIFMFNSLKFVNILHGAILLPFESKFCLDDRNDNYQEKNMDIPPIPAILRFQRIVNIQITFLLNIGLDFASLSVQHHSSE